MRIFKITDNLYQSGHLEGWMSWIALKWSGIEGVVDLEDDPDRSSVRKHATWYHYWPIHDGPLPDTVELWKVANMIYDKMGHMKVLVHCGGGVNRSSLVTGCVLYLMGYRVDQIVELIRRQRPGALTNSNFELFLRNLK